MDRSAPDTSAPDRSAADDLLAQLTLEEKIALLHQDSPGVPRLGLAPFRTGTEGLHGVSWLGTATVFPQPIGLAATWDTDLVTRVGEVVATEVRAKHAENPAVSLNVWAPVVNSLRHPLWGRGEEGYSEDPDLTAELAAAYSRGLRGDHPTVWKTVPTLKHFLAYSNEVDRAVTSSHLPAQALREYELPAFQGPLASGAVGAVMPSYNLVNGRPNHVARELLDEMRTWAPGSIAVTSDAQAPSNLVDGERYFRDHVASHAAALLAGIDSFTDNDTNAAPTIERFTAALKAGLVTEEDIDRAVLRVLTLRENTGEFSSDDPYAAIPADAIDLPEHRALAREAVARSVVLLENHGALPLQSPARIAVVGPFADHVVHDWYSGTPPYRTSIASALAARYPDAEVVVADGADRLVLRSLSTGTYLEVAADGSAITASATAPGTASELDVADWGEGLLTLRSALTGKLLTGSSWIIAATAERVGGWVAQESFRFHRHSDATVSIQHLGSRKWLRVQAGSHLLVAEAELEQAERFVVRVVSSGTAAVAAACAGAEVSIVAVGNDPHLLGRETEDRPHLALPQSFAEIWRTAASATSGASVLAVVSSYPYAIPAEAASADAALWTSHGGQELGPGLVDVLAGDVEPSGRLQQTWWAREADAGDVLEYDVVQAQMTYRYSPAQPLYAFGHGLTYSAVAYEGVKVSRVEVEAPAATLQHVPALGGAASEQADELVATVHVRNTGGRVAHELVALYALAPTLPIPAPRTRLAAWARVTLQPGEARSVRLGVPLGLLAVWDVAANAGSRTAATPGAYRVQPGVYELASGPSAADLPVRAKLVVTGDVPAARRLADLGALEAHGFHRSFQVGTSDRKPLLGSVIEVAPGAVQGWAQFDGLDLAGVSALTIEVADRGGIGRPSVAVAWRPAGQQRAAWRPLGSTAVVSDGRYDLRTVEVALAEPVTMAADLRVTLTGGARLASLSA